GGDIAWISYSKDHGATWSAPIQVNTDSDNSPHIVQVVGGFGPAYVAWLTDAGPAGSGWTMWFRPFSISQGWLTAPMEVSKQEGIKASWPGDTFGIAWLPSSSSIGRQRIALTWGSAYSETQSRPSSQIYSSVVSLDLAVVQSPVG
ncbi:MAG TPA: hypothetical protein VGS21_00545, partial [Acidimicrobiales bacterium]|nr:hypothetical protein [Acidimicrobiales bacterium]